MPQLIWRSRSCWALPDAPNYAGLRIIATGIEISTVGAPGEAITKIVQPLVSTAKYEGSPIPITYRTVKRTEAALDGLRERIFETRDNWVKSGVELTSWGVDVPTNTVVITLKHYTDEAASSLRAAYGSDNITVFPEDFEVTASGRYDDSSSWYGGDAVSIGGAGTCTSYFSLYSTGNHYDYNATAGHCGLGNAVSNGIVQGSAVASRLRWTNGGNTDVVLWPLTTGGQTNTGRIWADPNAVTRNVTSRSTGDPIGGLICTGGVTDREVCAVEILRSGDVTYFGKTLHGQILCHQQSDGPAFRGGDSGGPVYAAGGTTSAAAFGMVVAARVGEESFGWYTPQRFIFAAYSNLTFQPYP